MKEYQIIDGKWHDCHSYIGCCDCGLVHRIQYRVVKIGKKTKIQARVWRRKRLTAEARKKKGIIFDKP